MSRLWQIFVAPGPDEEPLPIPPSPWHVGRTVRIPREHWLLILQFAARINDELSSELNSCSSAVDNNPDDEITVRPERLTRLIGFMRRVGDDVSAADPLVSEATAEVPDELTNDEHARMIAAVVAVFEEAALLRQPFRAWAE